MKKQIVVASTLAFFVCASFLTPVQANPIAAPACKDVPSCVVTGTVVIGGIVYYVIKNTVTGVVQRIPVRRVPPSHSNEQHEEKLFPDMGSKTCQQLADEETARTGKKWYVKNWGPVPYTGPLWNPSQKVKFECTITTDPNAARKGD